MNTHKQHVAIGALREILDALESNCVVVEELGVNNGTFEVFCGSHYATVLDGTKVITLKVRYVKEQHGKA